MPLVFGEVVPKVWGYTVCVKDSPVVDIWFAHAKPQGYSSRHRHPDKSNEFRVLSGLLRVEYWLKDKPEGPPNVQRYLEAGEHVTIPAGVWHRFVALRETDLIETYQHDRDVPLINIERFDEGGVGAPPF